MYLIKEEAIIAWKNSNGLLFLNCACKFTEMDKINEGTSKRKEIKKLIYELRKSNPNVDKNIFTSMSNVNLNCVLGYSMDRKKYNFLDNYDN